MEIRRVKRYAVCMRSSGFAVVLSVSALTLSADTLTVTKMTFGGRTTIRKEYVQGDNSRSEYETFEGDAPARQEISIRVGGKVGYQIDATAREYVEYPIPPRAVPARSPAIEMYQSGKTLDVYIEITDTGERKVFFGQTARHLLWRERSVAEPGACGTSSTREHDGWYLPEPEKAAAQSFAMILGGVSGRKICRDRIVVHGHRPAGLAVIADDGSFRTEIIELSHEPLDNSLFAVPSGYTKVTELPRPPSPPLPPPSLSQRIVWEWRQLARELESWFR